MLVTPEPHSVEFVATHLGGNKVLGLATKREP